MDAGLERRLAHLQRQKDVVLAGIDGWPDARLRFRTEPGTWSTIEVLDHLVKVEEVMLDSVRARLGRGGVVGARERTMAWVVRLVMRSPMRVRVPPESTAVARQPTGDVAEVVTRWARARGELRALGERLTAAQLHEAVAAHPRSGPMTFGMTLRFISTHLQHHGYQLRRLREASRAAA